MQTYIGIIQRGSKRAAALGYPTINIPLDDEGVSGVYAAVVKIGEEEYEAAAYADRRRKILEAHLLDFSKDLYGWNVKIRLVKKVREYRKFKNSTEQKETIDEDVAKVREYFKN